MGKNIAKISEMDDFKNKYTGQIPLGPKIVLAKMEAVLLKRQKELEKYADTIQAPTLHT